MNISINSATFDEKLKDRYLEVINIIVFIIIYHFQIKCCISTTISDDFISQLNVDKLHHDDTFLHQDLKKIKQSSKKNLSFQLVLLITVM